MNPSELDTDDTLAAVDILAGDFVARYRNGERPTIEEYADRHPDLGDSIRQVFPLVLSVEKVKIDQQTEADGSATLAGREFQQLGDFRLLREIGRGGMGIVYEAQQDSLGRLVAIKVLPKQSLLDDESLGRFQREASTAAAMHHSNIVPIFGSGECEGTHYLVMQLVRGESLDRKIAAAGSDVATEASGLDCRKAAEIASQIADGLVYAHDCGVLHRDVKPANILIDEDGIAQLTDFGLARNSLDDPTMTQVLSGSPRYMAPERFRGHSDERCDIYGLGLTLYEMLSGAPAFADVSSQELIDAVTQHRIRPLRQLCPDVPIDLSTIVARAVSPDPADRYQSALELRDDLKRYIADRPILARRISPPQRLLRWCRRNPRFAAVSGVAIFSLLAATIASTAGLAMTAAANARTRNALAQSETTVDLALQSLNGVVEAVSTPENTAGDFDSADVASYEFDSGGLQLTPSPHAARILTRVQPLYQRLANQSPSRPDIVLQMTEAGIRLSDIQRQLGKGLTAESTLRKHIDLLQSRCEVVGLSNDQIQTLRARLYNKLGDLLARELRDDESDEFYEQAIAAIELISAPDERTQLQLAYACVSLADPPLRRRRNAASAADRSSDAENRMLQAEEILSRLSRQRTFTSEVAVLRARVELARSRVEQRPALRQSGFSNAIKILSDQLSETPDDVRVRFAMVETLASVNLRRQGRSRVPVEIAEQRLRQALAELQPLRSRAPDTPLFAVSEVHIRHKLSNLMRLAGDTVAATQQLDQAIQIQSRLVEQAPESMPNRCWRALLYRSLANTHRRSGNSKAEQLAIDAAVQDTEAINAKYDSHPFVQQTKQIIDEIRSTAGVTQDADGD